MIRALGVALEMGESGNKVMLFSLRKSWFVWLAVLAGLAGPGFGADRPQWGEALSRNMVSSETGLPSSFNPATDENVKWSVPLGDNAYGSPVIASGRVLIGANNKDPRDPGHTGDRAVMLCLDETDGSLVWQLVVPRIADDDYKDWPMIAMCSPPTVEVDRVYALTNRLEVVCLDLNGLADGNDGPYTDEARHMSPSGEATEALASFDADILWITDLPAEAGVYPHDSAHSSILLDGAHLYLNSCNGVDNTHAVIRKPEAPSLVVLDKGTGRIVARDGEKIGPIIFHSTWASPSMGEAAGQRAVFFGGGDGVCYAFAVPEAVPDSVQTLKRIWRFDCDPEAPKTNVHEYLKDSQEGPSNIKGMPVFYKNRVYVVAGGDIWWGKKQAWLKCIDATQTGDITKTGELWSYPMDDHSCATPAIADGLIYVTDCSGTLHCVDAETGAPYWTHELKREIWGSAFVADAKVYASSRGNDFWIFEAGKEKKVLSSVELDASLASTAVAANGVLYVTTLEKLYALAVPDTAATSP